MPDVKIYNKSGALFVLQQAIQDLTPVQSEHFGTALSMSSLGNHIAVGAYNKTVDGFYGNGYAGQFDRNGTLWTQTHSYSPISETNLGIGMNVDISETHMAFTVAKKKQLTFLDLGWSGYDINFDDEIHSISIDPVTDYFYVFAGKDLHYSFGGSNTQKLKTLAADVVYTLPNVLSVYKIPH